MLLSVGNHHCMFLLGLSHQVLVVELSLIQAEILDTVGIFV